MPNRETVTLFGVIAAGLTLIGATTYFVATRLIRKKHFKKEHGKKSQGEGEDELYTLSDEEDDLDYRMSNDRRRKARRGLGAAVRPPPLITVAELFEQAFLLNSDAKAQRNVKIYFDSNDEFVREEQIPELMQPSARSILSSDESIMYGYDEQMSHRQRLQEAITFKYSCVNVFFGNEDVQNSGTTRITRNIFAGTNDRTENAMLFLNNLSKIKQTKNQHNLSKHVQMVRKLGKG